jgi:hypothetical protein
MIGEIPSRIGIVFFYKPEVFIRPVQRAGLIISEYEVFSRFFEVAQNRVFLQKNIQLLSGAGRSRLYPNG